MTKAELFALLQSMDGAEKAALVALVNPDAVRRAKADELNSLRNAITVKLDEYALRIQSAPANEVFALTLPAHDTVMATLP